MPQAAQPTQIMVEAPGSVSGFQRLGYVVLVGYLFLIYSRVFDVKFSFLHIPGISSRIIMIMMLLSRSFIPAIKHPLGKGMYFMTFWFCAAVPTSMWRGGSIALFTGMWLPAFVIFLAVTGFIVNFDQCKKAINTIGYGLLVLTLIAVVYGSTEETGRLFLPNGKFANPNEMAQALLMGLPIWWFILQESQALGKKVFAAGSLFLMLIIISKCGSRGALITIVALTGLVFLRASIMGKMKLVVGGLAIIAILVAMMPGKLLRRYRTLGEDEEPVTVMSDDYDAAMETSAVTSTQHRRELLKKSIRYTFQHPLFGVGPGMFPVAEDADMRAQGFRKGTWQGTHNSYTQISSEMGIPAAIGYIFIIVVAFRRSSAIYKRTKDDLRLTSIANASLALNNCIVVYAVSVFFDYIAYTSMLPVFAGLVMALDLLANAEIERRTAMPAAPPPIPYTQFRANWRRTAGVPQEA
jgi:O-antigen ligase